MSERPTQAEIDVAIETHAQEVEEQEVREHFELGIKSINFPLTRKGEGYRSSYTDYMWLAYQHGWQDESKLREKDAAELKNADDTISLLMERNSAHAATITSLNSIISVQHTNLVANQQTIAQLKEEITTMRLERGNKVALLLLDIADEQLKQQALQSELSEVRARESRLHEALADLVGQIESFACKYGEADFETYNATQALSASQPTNKE